MLASWNYAQELESYELEVIQAGIAISWKLEAGAATESWIVKAGSCVEAGLCRAENMMSWNLTSL